MPEETALASLASEVDDARGALLDAARTKPGAWWHAEDLIHAAKGQWRDAVVMIALDELIGDSTLEADPRWKVRLPE